MYRPDLEFERDTDDLTPGQAHDRWESVTNLQADDLDRLEASERNEVYLERAEGNETSDPPIEGGPLEDAQHLAETPRSEWGPDERAEADEAINFFKRTLATFDQSEGEPLLPDEEPRIHKDEMSIARWGVDVAPDDGWP